jgi:hypothetical protein
VLLSQWQAHKLTGSYGGAIIYSSGIVTDAIVTPHGEALDVWRAIAPRVFPG